MWEFNIMQGGHLLQDRECICNPLLMMRHRKCHLTFRMVRHIIDPRHLTARNFPNSWITNPTFLDKTMVLFARFGDVVAIVDVSEKERRDGDRDCERTVAVEFFRATCGIQAMKTLDGVDNRSNRRKSDNDFAPPRNENRLVCRITGSPVLYESCDCVARNCNASWRLVWNSPPCYVRPRRRGR